MKSRESLIRLHRFQLDEKRRKVVEIETMMADFKQKEAELDQQIEAEQQRSGISDVNHFAYPTFAKAAIDRRDNLKVSAANLESQLGEAKEDLAVGFDELKKVELLQEKEEVREHQERNQRDQVMLDDVGRDIFRRNRSSS